VLDYQIVRLVSDRHEWRYVGKMHQALGADWREVLNAYLQAYEFRFR
jgi:hypothetical protein